MNVKVQNVLERQVQSLSRRILLVEDNPADAEFIAERLKHHNLLQNEVVHVSSLNGALERLQSREFDAVLLDLRLPDGAGLECLRAVCERAIDVPVVVITGVDDDSLALSCIAEGAQDYIQKDEIPTQDLNRAVSYAMARAGEIEQRRSADALRQRLAQIVDVARDAIVSSSVDGLITSWNKGAERTFGFTSSEAIGQSLMDLICLPNDGLRAVPKGGDALLSAHERDGQHVEFSSLTKEGDIVDISAIASELHDAAGRIGGLAAICRDVSERQRRDTELRRRNSELLVRDERMRSFARYITDMLEQERARISREVHDGLGQQLSAVKWDLQAATHALGSSAKSRGVREKVMRAMEQVEQSMQAARKIALELRPSVLDALGLGEALRDEARRFSERTGCRVDVDVRTDLRPPKRTATALFRIFQELLTNVGLHARASNVAVDVDGENGDLVIRVADDGIGMDLDAASVKSSLGLLGIQERARMVDASFSIGRRQEGGTLAVVRVRC